MISKETWFIVSRRETLVGSVGLLGQRFPYLIGDQTVSTGLGRCFGVTDWLPDFCCHSASQAVTRHLVLPHLCDSPQIPEATDMVGAPPKKRSN